MKALIFDFDGVIEDSFEFHVNKISEFTGFNLSKKELRYIHTGNFFKKAPKELHDVDWKDYRDYIFKEQTSLIVKKNIKKTLLELHNKFNLFIISSGGTKNIKSYLSNNKVSIFKEVLGFEKIKSKEKKFEFIFKKYSLTPKECIFITDTLGDIIEANDVNVKTIAVDFGYHSRSILKKGNPFAIISDLNEINEIL